MSGTIPLSLSQQLDKYGKPLIGGSLYIIQAGTVSTPQIAYQDAALTIPYPGGSKLTLDAAGRLGQFFLADGLVKIRLTDADGLVQIEADGVQVIGPSSGGGGGGGSVDPTTIFQTGDTIFVEYDGVRTGWVRQNGRTIGSATSGGTERSNADTQALFVWLWNNFTNSICAVSGGRGASAAADFAANKTITLLDKRGKIPFGLDTMGNSAAGRFAGTQFSTGDGTVPGSPGGSNVKVLSASQIPTITSNGSNLISVTSANSVVQNASTIGVSSTGSGAQGYTAIPANAPLGSSGTNSISVTSNNTGGQAHDIMPSFVVGSYYQKL